MPSPIVEKATSGHCVNRTSFVFSHAQSTAGKFMCCRMQSRREYNPFHNALDTSKKPSIKPCYNSFQSGQLKILSQSDILTRGQDIKTFLGMIALYSA